MTSFGCLQALSSFYPASTLPPTCSVYTCTPLSEWLAILRGNPHCQRQTVLVSTSLLSPWDCTPWWPPTSSHSWRNHIWQGLFLFSFLESKLPVPWLCLQPPQPGAVYHSSTAQSYAPILHDDTQGILKPLTHTPASALCPSQTDLIKYHLYL